MGEWLGTIFAVIALTGCLLVAVLMTGKLYFIGLHLVLRRRGLADEAERLSHPLPPDAELPHIIVQIPVFNEGAIVERAMKTVAKFDWPKDKLHIQICDDSNDKTTELAKAVVLEVSATGVDIVLLHRSNRADFKAGSLREGMRQTSYNYFAIFDVDYVPPANFLRRCMAVLLSDPKFAFVQGRPDFLNANETVLTRAQSMILDAHHAIEQATRSWANRPLPFNGTCGIWRRDAIEAGGGWEGSTLVEDMDLSYRIWLKGWRGIFLTTVSAPGELPTSVGTWISQQKRWVTGSGQVARATMPAIWRDPQLTGRARYAALFDLALTWVDPLLNLTYIAAVLGSLMNPSLIVVIVPTIMALILYVLVIMFLELRISNRFLRGADMPMPKFILNFCFVVLFETYKIPFNMSSFFSALSKRRLIFERTPKKGSII